MTDDDNISLYLYALGATGAILASIWLLTPQQIEVARLSVDAVEVGAIETASIASARDAEATIGWNDAEIPWRGYEEGMRRMAESGKKGVLVLQADWCLVCRSYQKLFHDKDVTRHSEDYVFMLADVEKEPALQKRFDVDGDYVPRTFLLNPDGTLARAATGGHMRQKFFVDPFRTDELLDLLKTDD